MDLSINSPSFKIVVTTYNVLKYTVKTIQSIWRGQMWSACPVFFNVQSRVSFNFSYLNFII